MEGEMGKIADISKYQGNVDWEKSRHALDFVILRASCGESIDTMYLHNVSTCGLPFGAYHYVKAGTAEDARKEARFFVECTRQGERLPCFYIADIEYKTQTESTTEAVCVAFLDELRTQGCAKIGLYINTRYKWAGKAIDMCDIMWIPHWGKNDGNVPADAYKPKYPHDIWQYTSKGTIPGIKGNVDLNVLTGTKEPSWFTAREDYTMDEQTNRALIPFTNEHFADFMIQMIGRPYWYGTCLYKCTESLRQRKASQYPSHYKDNRTATYRKHIEAKEVAGDCIGGAKGYAWTNGGEGVVEAIGNDNAITSKYGSHGCPDKSASGMFAYAKEKGMAWGAISTIPEIVGLAVTFSGHVGYYIGGGYVAEFKGFSYGCVKTKLSAGKWTHWYQLPFLDYGNTSDAPAHEPSEAYTLGSRLLAKGSKGDDVAQLQRILFDSFGYDLGTYGANKDGVDGSFGDKTEKAVKRIQAIAQITVDGKYGSVTHKALMGLLDDMDKAEIGATPDDPQEDSTNDTTGKRVCVTGNNVNIRSGPATTYKVLTRVNKGDTLPYIATADSVQWHAVEIGGKVGWISGKYAEVKEG